MGILDLFEREKLHVTEEACLNHLSRQTVCDACVFVCPKGSLSLTRLSKHPILFSSFSCSECGACVSACPTLVFDLEYKPYHAILEEIKRRPEARIHCDRDAESAGIKISCYLQLDPVLIAHYAKGKKELSFSIHRCGGCNRGGKEAVLLHFDWLKRELLRLGIGTPIHLSHDPIPHAEWEGEGISRRELLQMLSPSRIRKKILEKTEERAKVQLPLRERMLLKRRKGKEAFRLSVSKKAEGKEEERAAVHSGGAVPDPSDGHRREIHSHVEIRIEGHCSGCLVCERICPTKALRWKREEGRRILLFQSDDCVECLKCTLCPQQVLKVQGFDKAEKGEGLVKEIYSMTVTEEKKEIDPRFFAL